jgi:hypothetical protein
VPVPLGLVPVPLGLVVEPPGVVVDGGVDGVVDGDVVVGGEADGVRSPGRSPTRSLLDSVQAVSIPRPSVTAQRPLSILFIEEPPPCGLRNLTGRVQRRCRRPGA